MNHTYKILKYLYNNNDGEYHPVQHAYCKNKLPSRKLLWDKIEELKILEYIELETKSRVRGFFDDSGDYPREFDNLSDDKHILYQIKITSLGEDYIDERTYNLFGIWLMQKRNGIVILIVSVTAIINLIINILLYIFKP